MKRLIIGLIVVMLLVPVSCAKAPPAPSTMPPPPVPVTEGVLIEMHTKTTLAGVARHLTISADGSIVFIEERGLRQLPMSNPPTRTTRTGQLTEAELSNLLAMVDACLFDVEGKCDARTRIIYTDAISELTVHYQKRTRIITANYQPLFHLFNPKTLELSDVPETVRKLYRELKSIIDNNTAQVSEEAISQADEGKNHTPMPAPGISPSGTDETHTPIKEMQGSSVDPAAPDALMPTPGFGPVYRANFHQEGVENPWPPIKISEAHLGGGSDNVSVLFRKYIKTAAGESRNNIIRATTSGKDIDSLSLYADDVPAGIELTVGSEWSGPLTCNRALLLVIEIAPDVTPGEYPLEIGLKINGKDYGTVLCKIEVTGSTTPNNGGMTSIIVQPEPGQYLVYDNQESAGVILKAVTIKSDVCDRDYMDLQGHATVRKGEPCLLVTGQVESQLDHDKYMTLSARGYDVNGEEVTYVLDAGPIWGVISIFVPANGINEFVLHLKTAPDIVKIELMPSPELYDIPPP